MKEAHCIPLAGHLVVHKTLAALVDRVWWVAMRHSIFAFVVGFSTYQLVKIPHWFF